MSKKIIVLSDGTGNSAAKVWRTNVWRTFEALDLTSNDQVAMYDDGVGTSSFKPIAILGGAFGYGLKRNVLSLYAFLCRNYKSRQDYLKKGCTCGDDEIFAFGFSRGAFTIRVLIGLVLDQGLVEFDTEEELSRKTRAAYRQYRAANFKTYTRIEVPFRWLRNLFVPAKHDEQQRPVAEVRFLGLWDTVAAYGLPIDEMMRGGVSRYRFGRWSCPAGSSTGPKCGVLAMHFRSMMSVRRFNRCCGTNLKSFDQNQSAVSAERAPNRLVKFGLPGCTQMSVVAIQMILLPMSRFLGSWTRHQSAVCALSARQWLILIRSSICAHHKIRMEGSMTLEVELAATTGMAPGK